MVYLYGSNWQRIKVSLKAGLQMILPAKTEKENLACEKQVFRQEFKESEKALPILNLFIGNKY